MVVSIRLYGAVRGASTKRVTGYEKRRPPAKEWTASKEMSIATVGGC